MSLGNDKQRSMASRAMQITSRKNSFNSSPKGPNSIEFSSSLWTRQRDNRKAGQRAASGQSCNSSRWETRSHGVKENLPFARVPSACTSLSKRTAQFVTPEIAIRITTFGGFSRVSFPKRKGNRKENPRAVRHLAV